jgi:hypothetical protein
MHWRHAIGNLDAYIDLSIMAKNAGGPAASIEKLAAQGFAKGTVVTAAAGLLFLGSAKVLSHRSKKGAIQKTEK